MASICLVQASAPRVSPVELHQQQSQNKGCCYLLLRVDRVFLLDVEGARATKPSVLPMCIDFESGYCHDVSVYMYVYHGGRQREWDL
eukprot:3098638-Amphidinium_carterae.1